MGVVEDYNRSIRSLRKQYEQHLAQNAEIEAKIAALERAKSILSRSKGKAKELKNESNRTELGSRWSGKLFNQVEAKKKKNVSNANTVITQHKDAIGEIDKHIWNLRLKIDYLAKALGNIENSISQITALRNKAIAEDSPGKSSSGGGSR